MQVSGHWKLTHIHLLGVHCEANTLMKTTCKRYAIQLREPEELRPARTGSKECTACVTWCYTYSASLQVHLCCCVTLGILSHNSSSECFDWEILFRSDYLGHSNKSMIIAFCRPIIVVISCWHHHKNSGHAHVNMLAVWTDFLI